MVTFLRTRSARVMAYPIEKARQTYLANLKGEEKARVEKINEYIKAASGQGQHTFEVSSSHEEYEFLMRVFGESGYKLKFIRGNGCDFPRVEISW